MRVSSTEYSENLERLTAPLLLWYEANQRHLPWREQVSAYTTWISEIMLQQTRVAAVLPYYERFLAELPNPAALAAVSEERLLKLWEGLGYYSRARNLKYAAQKLIEEYDGVFPQSVQELQKLPGIGPYTSAAIASIAFGIAEPAVDGNLLRVASRIMGDFSDVIEEKTRRRFRDLLRAAMDKERPGQWNQAMMDLGAIVCLPNGMPLCEHCPGRSCCEAYRNGWQSMLPVRKEKKPRRIEERGVFLMLHDGKIALHRRPTRGLLAGLWEFPNAIDVREDAEAQLALASWNLSTRSLHFLGCAKHVFTHMEWHMRGYFAKVEQEIPEFTWLTEEQVKAYAIPSAFRFFTEQLPACFAEKAHGRGK